MKKIKTKFLKTELHKMHRSFYAIQDPIYEIENKKFKIDKAIVNLTIFLKKRNLTIFDLFEKNNICKNCGKETYQYFSRKKLVVYHFCDIECQHNYIKKNEKQICKICKEEFYKINKIYNTCGKDYCINENRKKTGEFISNSHWCKGEGAKEIEKQRLETRLKNDKLFDRKYIAWNKGKTGIYSKETIEKIRNAVIRQMDNGFIKKTGIEIIIEDFLKEENINYKYSFILKKRQYDFLLNDYNIIIEADGDFWHGNQTIDKFKILSERQILKQKDDRIKDILAKENDYDIIRFWENDIHNNFEDIKNKIRELICKKQHQEF